jgi:nitrogen-specific signal transduction histidine kinase
VADTGRGLPEALRVDPFHPVKSGKKGGSGVGLAIAAHLAGQADAGLTLENTGASGTVFALRIQSADES